MSYDFRIINKKIKIKKGKLLCQDGTCLEFDDSRCNQVTTKNRPCPFKEYGGTIRCDDNGKPLNVVYFEFNMTYNYAGILYKIPCMKKKGIRTLYGKNVSDSIDCLENACKYICEKYINVWYKSVNGDKSYKNCFLSRIYKKIPENLDESKFSKYLINKEKKIYDLSNVSSKDSYVLNNKQYFTEGYPERKPTLKEMLNQKDILDDYWSTTPANVYKALHHILMCLYWIKANYKKSQYENFVFVGD